MGYIIAGNELQGQLEGLLEPVEIRDSTGRILGLYTPASTLAQRAGYDKVRAMIDSGELDRRWEAEAGNATPIGPLLEKLRSME